MRYLYAVLMVGLLLSMGFATMGFGQTKLAVSVVDSSGMPVPDLKPESFTVTDPGSHTVSAALFKPSPVDVAMLIEASAYTNSQKADIQRLAILLIDQMAPRDRTAIYQFSESPEMMQEFTSNKQSLVNVVPGLDFGNNSSMFDSAYKVLDKGFAESTARKVLLIFSSAQEGTNRMKALELVELAERRGVSIYAISFGGKSGFLEELTRQTAGTSLSGRGVGSAYKNLWAAFRGQYELTVDGPELQAPIRVEVKGMKDKTQVSHRKLL